MAGVWGSARNRTWVMGTRGSRAENTGKKQRAGEWGQKRKALRRDAELASVPWTLSFLTHEHKNAAFPRAARSGVLHVWVLGKQKESCGNIA